MGVEINFFRRSPKISIVAMDAAGTGKIKLCQGKRISHGRWHYNPRIMAFTCAL
jgi:hypothetical protein